MKTMTGMLLFAGLCCAGCATEPASGDPAEGSTSQSVATGVQCSDKAWKINFYSDATYTTIVGSMSCTCWGPEILDGLESDFNLLVRERDCSIQ